jgi:hypothetical protein
MFLLCTGVAKTNAPLGYDSCGLCPGLSPGSNKTCQISINNTVDMSGINNTFDISGIFHTIIAIMAAKTSVF